MGGKIRRVSDRDLGELWFPAGDQIMAPFIDEHHTYIPSEIEWLKQQVLPGSNCLNVGANVGYFTLWIVRRFAVVTVGLSWEMVTPSCQRTAR
jgi:hypothetical protein